MDTLIKVNETPWGTLGTKLENITNVAEIIPKTNYSYTVNYLPMKTDIHDSVKNYCAVYREDNNSILGVINIPDPNCIQNSDMFNIVNGLYDQNKLEFVTISQLNYGAQIFGIFKFIQNYEIFGETIDHYIIILNDHTKSDGKVTIIHLPVLRRSETMLIGMIPKSWQKFRVFAPVERYDVSRMTDDFLDMFNNIQSRIISKFTKFSEYEISNDNIEKFLDITFPFMYDTSGQILATKENEKIDLYRSQFMSECYNFTYFENFEINENLLQLYLAMLDFDQHMYKKLDSTYDLSYRIKRVPGLNTEKGITDKGLEYINNLIK